MSISRLQLTNLDGWFRDIRTVLGYDCKQLRAIASPPKGQVRTQTRQVRWHSGLMLIMPWPKVISVAVSVSAAGVAAVVDSGGPAVVAAGGPAAVAAGGCGSVCLVCVIPVPVGPACAEALLLWAGSAFARTGVVVVDVACVAIVTLP